VISQLAEKSGQTFRRYKLNRHRHYGSLDELFRSAAAYTSIGLFRGFVVAFLRSRRADSLEASMLFKMYVLPGTTGDDKGSRRAAKSFLQNKLHFP